MSGPLPASFDLDYIKSTIDTFDRSNRVYAWDLDSVRAARDALMVGNFRKAALLEDAVMTDADIYGAQLNRICPHRGLPRIIKCSKARIAKEARLLYGRDKPGMPGQVIADCNAGLVHFGVFVCTVKWLPRSDGSRIDAYLEPWPMSAVYWDANRRTLRAITKTGIVDITHGDGKWVVFSLHAERPWQYGVLKPVALAWVSRAYAIRDRQLNAETHGMGKFLGELAEGVDVNSPEAADFKSMVMQLRTGRSGGIYRKGGNVKLVEAMSGMWQIFKEAIGSIDRDIARAYLGQDGSLINEGGNYIKAAQLFNVRQDIVEGDLSAMADALTTGVLRPWAMINFGIEDISTEWLIPDPDEDARRESYGKRTDAFNKAIKEYRENGFDVSQSFVDIVADEFGILPPTVAVAAELSNPLITPTDTAIVVKVDEVRRNLKLEPWGDDDGTLSVLAMKAKQEAQFAAVGEAEAAEETGAAVEPTPETEPEPEVE